MRVDWGSMGSNDWVGLAGEGNPIPLHVSRGWEAVLRSVEPENGESPRENEVKRRLKDALE